ncbi:prepilin peptidase [Parashewanella spongiae]|uniref:Prepilin peptidase n=1 Tax=Parashewanella spongiae TaxID=342950 RepID=A0A3A6TWR4_9GAMM|nr:primosomal replication protein [Parashewanella spongiae]MCL1077824.1 primosomal replication protein [Parashewanella spongiae]RJY18877.1 prepilin peptidase [Parashewanella spongiae]
MVLRLTESLSLLKRHLEKLEQEVLQHDSALAKGQKTLLQNVDRFNESLFIQTGAQLGPCINQIRKGITQLEKRIKVGLTTEVIETSCLRIQDQFSAVKRALNTTDLNLKSVRQQKASARARYLSRQKKNHQKSGFEWIASNVMQSSHQLYEELNKHLNWVSKFEQRIHELDLKLESCLSRDKLKLQNEILSMHKRLGKCRQAISYIEERIQMLERPNYKNNR